MRRRIWRAGGLWWVLGLVLLTLGCAYTGSSKPAATPESEFEEAKSEYDEGHHFDAVLKLTEFIDRHPGSILVDQAIFYLGKAYQAQKDWLMAAAEFERLVRDFPESRSACDAEFALAECYWHQSRKPQYDQRETEQAIVQLSRYLDRCPEHEGAAEADELIDKALDRLAEKRYRAAKLYAKLKRPDAALLYCDLLVSEFGDSRWVCDARRLKAELLVNLTRFVEARAEIQWLEQNCADSDGLSGEIEALEHEMADAEADRS